MKQLSEILREQNLSPELSVQEVLDSYNHIKLTEEEILQAIIEGKRKKEAILKAQELQEKQEKNRQALTASQWNYKQTESFMLYRKAQIFEGKLFEIDDTNRIIFEMLCYYFSNDRMFLAMATSLGVKNPSLDKGIFLAGNFGAGKTWMMKLFSRNQRQVFYVKNAKFIADAFSQDGDAAVTDFVDKIKNPVNDSAVFFQPFTGICIDDIGTEDIKSHYGNKKNVIGDLIEMRYAKGNTGVFLHATTNLKAEQLGEFYGGRVVSRMREIFNFIEFPGKDRRV